MCQVILTLVNAMSSRGKSQARGPVSHFRAVSRSVLNGLADVYPSISFLSEVLPYKVVPILPPINHRRRIIDSNFHRRHIARVSNMASQQRQDNGIVRCQTSSADGFMITDALQQSVQPASKCQLKRNSSSNVADASRSSTATLSARQLEEAQECLPVGCHG